MGSLGSAAPAKPEALRGPARAQSRRLSEFHYSDVNIARAPNRMIGQGLAAREPRDCDKNAAQIQVLARIRVNCGGVGLVRVGPELINSR
jgi:hypothetical protein